MKNILQLLLVFIFSQVILAQTTNFEGITYSGEVPPDPVIAVSNDYIVQAVNKKLAVFNKTGTKLFEQSFSTFFSNQSPPSSIFDPKVAYDQYSNRFILLAAGKNTGGGNSNYMLAVTQTADPTGSWHKYKLNAEDQNLTQYDIDFPGLGYDEEAIYLTSHQIYGSGGSTSHYPKITILKKSEVYEGTISYRKDFWDFSPYPAKLKPMRKFGSSSGYFLVNTEDDAKQIRIWKIENPLGGSNATLNSVATKTLGNYSSISAAVQKGSQNTVDIGDYSISDVVCKDGFIYGAYTAQNTTSNGSMIVYFKIDINNNYNLDINGKIETENKYYYYPVLHPDNDGNIVFTFNKSSTDDYIGVAWTVRYAGNPNIEPIQWLKQGSTWYYHLLNDENRWGDYCGIALDPANGYRIWICGEWAYSNDQWSTQIGSISTGQTVNFTFTNTIYDEDTGILNANAAGTLNVNSIPVNSGDVLPLVQGNSYTEKTNNERFPNWNSLGYTYKHNHWNSALTEKFLSNNLEATSNTDQRAFFKSLNYSQININLEGQLITGKGAGEFQDPWYVLSNGSQPGNYWIPCTATYEPNGNEGAVEKGVFLDQGWPTWAPPYYSVKAAQTQNINLGSPWGTRAFYFQNWTANTATSASFQNAGALETGVVFKEANATVTANYKGHLLSNSSTSFSTIGQRKIVAEPFTSNRYLVYDSQGYIWYSKSTDNGVTWSSEIKMSEEGAQAKGASIAVANGYTYILYQSDHDLWNNPWPNLILRKLASNGSVLGKKTVYDLGNSYSYNTMATVTADLDHILVVFKPNATTGLLGREFLDRNNNYGWGTLENVLIFPGTTQYSVNPSLAVKYVLPNRRYMLAYQESYGTIYCKEWDVATDLTNLTTTNLTTGSPYSINSSPTIVAFGTGARVCWIGSAAQYSAVVFRDADPSASRFWSFGFYASSPSITATDNNSAYFLGWKENGTGFKIVDNHLSNTYMKTLTDLQGNAIQLSNGVNADVMYAMTYNNASQPYALTPSNSLGSYYRVANKENANSMIASGRAGVVIKDAAQFFFMLGDIEVNGEKIRFKELSDTLKIPTMDVFNTLVESEPFELKANSSFTYSVEYGVTDTTLATQVLQNDENVKFNVEVVDASSGQIVGTLDPVSYSKNFLQSYSSIDYQVSTEAIRTMNVKLRLIVDHSGDASYSITNRFYDEDVTLAKKGAKVITLNKDLQIKNYAMEQNYPNPFNPATTITYQLPKSGSVTLKIFDILGSEVKTLVNEQKEMGRYTVQFDASSLASGMYVYQLRANDYTSTKKMMLLK